MLLDPTFFPADPKDVHIATAGYIISQIDKPKILRAALQVVEASRYRNRY